MRLEPASVRASDTSWQIAIKFYLKHHWGGRKAALGFGLDRIRTLIFMATDSSLRVIMGDNIFTTLSSSFLIGSFLFLQVTRKCGGVAQWLGRRVSDQGVPGSNPGRCTIRCRLEQVTFTLLSTG